MREGYKLTELGEIPEDWELKKFEDVMTGFFSGQTPSRAKPSFYKGAIRWITSGELNYNFINDTIEKITEDAVRKTNLKILPKGTFLIAITGLEAAGTRGSCGIVGEEATTNQSCMALIPKRDLDNGYLYHYYVKNGDWLAFKYCQGTKQQSYTGKIAKLLPIALPPKKQEQIAIAKTLSQTDSLIQSLERLIVKKQAIRQGIMQLLLTGRERLKGFNKKWEESSLGEIGKVSGAGVDKKISDNEILVRLVNYMDIFRKDFIYSKDLFHEVSAPLQKIRQCAVQKGDIFFTPSSETRTDIGIAAVAMEDISDAVYSYHIVRLRLHIDWDLKFRTYIFKTRFFLDQAEALCEGSGKRYVLTLKKFRELTIRYPIDKEEQTAIATVLNDMDNEISSLQNKLYKLRLIKQGMMQTLLTGKIRLL